MGRHVGDPEIRVGVQCVRCSVCNRRSRRRPHESGGFGPCGDGCSGKMVRTSCMADRRAARAKKELAELAAAEGP